jgi:hypothetical protein
MVNVLPAESRRGAGLQPAPYKQGRGGVSARRGGRDRADVTPGEKEAQAHFIRFIKPKRKVEEE